MKKTFYTTFFSLTFLVMVTIASSVFAQGGNPGGPGGNPGTPGGNPAPTPPVNITVTLTNPFKIGNDLYLVSKGIVEKVILPIGGVLCVLAFIYSGFLYVTAGGNKANYEQANKSLLYSAIGTAVLLGAWVIATVIETTVRSIIR